MKLLWCVLGWSLLFSGCGSGPTCLTGASIACTCEDGRSGAQVCRPDGTLGTCACASGAGGGSGGGGGAGGGGGGTGGGSGGGSAGAPKRVFVSSVLFGSNLGGLQGADAKCTALAAAAGHGGTWRAWLSTSTSDAINRIADVGPWFLMTGEKAFTNKFGLMGAPLVALVITEEGTTLGSGRLVWTGTKTGGTAVTSTGTNGMKRFHTCADWTSSDWATPPGGWIGLSSTSSTSGWTDDQSVISGGKLCGTDGTDGARIYCFEQ